MMYLMGCNRLGVRVFFFFSNVAKLRSCKLSREMKFFFFFFLDRILINIGLLRY